MNSFIIKYFLLLFFLNAGFVFAQDTTHARGHIKVAKPKDNDASIYINAFATYGDYDYSKIKNEIIEEMTYSPMPVVERYFFPFNYTKYFNEKFRGKPLSLLGKESDTVFIEVKILPNGKVYMRDRSNQMMVEGVPALYNEKVGGYELNDLHWSCMKYMKDIKEWDPAFAVLSKKGKYKGQTVIKPKKTAISSTALITIVFSSFPLDEQ